MKDLENANYVLQIQIFRDRKNKILALSQSTYIDKGTSTFLDEEFQKRVYTNLTQNYPFQEVVSDDTVRKGIYEACTICVGK